MKQPKRTQNFKIGRIWNFRFEAFVAQILNPNIQIWAFWTENSLILTKFRVYSISKVIISNQTLVFEKLDPKSQVRAFWVKKYQLSSGNKISTVFYFAGIDFKSDFRFQHF